MPDVIDDALDRGIDRKLGRIDHEVGRLRRLIGRRDAGEVADLAGARQLVEAFRIAALADR
jgi:hypothetical protein